MKERSECVSTPSSVLLIGDIRLLCGLEWGDDDDGQWEKESEGNLWEIYPMWQLMVINNTFSFSWKILEY